MPQISDLTTKEICDLRLKCLEIHVITASKHGIEKGQVFDLARQTWEYMTEAIEKAPKGNAAKRQTAS